MADLLKMILCVVNFQEGPTECQISQVLPRISANCEQDKSKEDHYETHCSLSAGKREEIIFKSGLQTRKWS